MWRLLSLAGAAPAFALPLAGIALGVASCGPAERSSIEVGDEVLFLRKPVRIGVDEPDRRRVQNDPATGCAAAVVQAVFADRVRLEPRATAHGSRDVHDVPRGDVALPRPGLHRPRAGDWVCHRRAGAWSHGRVESVREDVAVLVDAEDPRAPRRLRARIVDIHVPPARWSRALAEAHEGATIRLRAEILRPWRPAGWAPTVGTAVLFYATPRAVVLGAVEDLGGEPGRVARISGPGWAHLRIRLEEVYPAPPVEGASMRAGDIVLFLEEEKPDASSTPFPVRAGLVRARRGERLDLVDDTGRTRSIPAVRATPLHSSDAPP